MAREELYQICVACEGSGVVRSVSIRKNYGIRLKKEMPCPFCKPLRVVEVGVSVKQLDKLVRLHLERADKAINEALGEDA